MKRILPKILDRNYAVVCCLLLLLSVHNSWSQEVLAENNNIKVSAHGYNDDREGGDESIFMVHSNGVITIQPMRGGSRIYRFYDGDLNLAETKELAEDKILPNAITLRRTFKLGDKIYGLGEKTTEQNNEVYLLEFDLNKFQFKSDYRTISSISGPGYFKNFLNAFMDVRISNDESKVLISHKLPERDGFLSFRLITLDGNLSLIEEHDIEFENRGGIFFPKGSSWTVFGGVPYAFGTGGSAPFKIDNEGVIYTFGHIKGDDENWSHCIIENGRVRYLKIEESENFNLYGMSIRQPTHLPEVWFFAKYKDSKKQETGFMIQKLSSHGAGEPIYLNWDNQILGEYLQKPQKKIDKTNAKGKQYEPENTNLISWHLLEDKTMLFVFERNYSVTSYDSKGRARTTYFSMNLLLTRIDEDGHILESTVIKKSQASGSSSLQSSFVFLENGMLNIVFNDHFSNIAPNWDGIKPARFSGTDNPVALVQVDPFDFNFAIRTHMWTTKDNKGLPIAPNIHGFYDFQPGKYVTWCNLGAKRDLLLFECK